MVVDIRSQSDRGRSVILMLVNIALEAVVIE